MLNSNPTSEKLSFWQLLEKTRIEIPIIQRDYAQGRKDKSEIRDSFLDSLFKAIDNDKPIELDFVYGGRKSDCLQPLDGQQRLTTLFLLHWYAAFKEDKVNENKNELTKFTYETRISSREFCNQLVEKGINYQNLNNGIQARKLSEEIENSSWFFLSWKKDPTIEAMLVMLDAIHLKFGTSNKLWEKLINHDHITFQFIELNDFGLSDDLYIKMNARGKALTEFENFKAKFEQHIQHEPFLSKTFSNQVDGSWTDLFWIYRNERNNLFDDEFLNFFRVMATSYYSFKTDAGKYFDDNISLLRSKETISFNKYLDLGCFDNEYTKQIIAILDKMSIGCSGNNSINKHLKDSAFINEESIFRDVIANDLSYADSVLFFAYSQYLNYETNPSNNESFSQWMRIARNLVEGSRLTYYNNAQEYSGSIKGISNLVLNRNNILDYLATTSITSISGFLSIQIEEEQLKAKLILKGSEWYDAIINIENHEYFKGQIGFLLKFSGISDYYEKNLHLNWSADENELFFATLNQYIDKAKVLFGIKGISYFQNYLIERALLATGDYLLSKGRNDSFLIDSERDISWKRLLRDDNDKRNVLKSLFDRINVASLKKDLEGIINQFDNVDDWRYNFIKYPENLKACGTNKLIRYNEDQDILLLESTTTSGYHREYFSYSLFVKIEKRVTSPINYVAQRSREYEKYFSIGNNGELKISFVDGQYKIANRTPDNLSFFKTTEDVEIFLIQNGFLLAS